MKIKDRFMIKNNKAKLIALAICVVIAIVSIILYFFIKNDNKNIKIGNNLSNKTL